MTQPNFERPFDIRDLLQMAADILAPPEEQGPLGPDNLERATGLAPGEVPAAVHAAQATSVGGILRSPDAEEFNTLRHEFQRRLSGGSGGSGGSRGQR